MRDDQQSTIMTEFLDELKNELACLTSYNEEADAAELADRFAEQLIETLRHDPRWAGITRFDFELLLADWQRQVARRIFRQVRNTVLLQDAYDAAKRVAAEAFGAEQTTPAFNNAETKEAS